MLLALLLLFFVSIPQDSLLIETEFEEVTTNLSRTSAVDVTPSGELFIVETGRNRLLILNQRGLRQDSLGARGTGDYRFDRPLDIDVTNGMRLYVADSRNQSVKMYDRRLRFLGMLTPTASTGAFSRFQPEMVSVNILGEAFVYDADSRSILRFSEQGNVSASIDLQMFDIEFPIRHMRVRDEVIYLIDQRGNVLHQLTTGGNYLGFTMMPHSVHRLAITETAVWAAGTEAIQKMNHRGRVVREFKNPTNQIPTGIAIKPGTILLLTERTLFRADF